MSTEPALLSLTEVAQAIAQKRFSSREVTQSCLERIAQWQPRLNAFMAIEAEEALAAADAADAALAKGKAIGALHGVPLAHKDMYYDAGKVVTCGSKIRRDFVATTTSTALQRLKDAGAIRLGSLQMAEFAYGPTGHNAHYGAVHNPWASDHITGGSSSGSGSAVAARLTFAALGSDTGGSIRMPAHFCGVTGLKTTYGRISRAGAMPLSQSLDTVGPLARTAEDCALLLGLMAGADPEDPTAIAGPCRTTRPRRGNRSRAFASVCPTAFYVDDLDAEVARILDETIAVSQARGRRYRRGRTAGPAPAHRGVPARSRGRGRRLSQALADRAPAGLRPAGPDAAAERACDSRRIGYLEAMRWRGPALAAHMAATAKVDAVLAPVAPVAAPTIAESDVGNSPDAEAVIQRLTRLHPPDQLSRPAVACRFPQALRAQAFPSACS